MARGRLSVVLVLALLGQAMAVPAGVVRLRRGYFDNELDSGDAQPAGLVYRDLVAAESGIRQARQNAPSESENVAAEPGIRQTRQNSPSDSENKDTTAKPSSFNDDDDDDDFAEPMNTAPSTGSGSNIFSLLNLANAFFPGSSASTILLRKLIREYLLAYQARQPIRRSDVKYNEIQLDDELKPPPLQKEKLEIEDESDNSESDSSRETEEDNDDNDDNGNDDDNNDEDNNDEDNNEDDDDNNGAEDSIENDDKGNNENGDSKPKQDDDDDDDDYDDDEPPGGGDGQGGGILGLLAGLSGGENGESDLGSLLAAVSGIVVNLSGDGVDINAIIAAGLGLFVGLLSEGEQNPGEIIAGYLLTSLDTITGGGSKNNGKFFGKFLSKLISGTSAGGDPEADDDGEGMQTKDSAGFFTSLLMGLLGEMSKGSSGGSSHPW